MLYAIYSKISGIRINGMWFDDERTLDLKSYNKTNIRKAREEGQKFAHIFKKRTKSGEVYYEYHMTTSI